MDIQQRLELLRLLSGLCDQQLTEPEYARLEELLQSDAEARSAYLQYVDLHVRLMGHPALLKAGDLTAAAKEALAAAAADDAALSPATEPRAARASRWLVPAGLIALALLVGAFLVPARREKGDSDQPTAAARRPERLYVATVAQSDDTEWTAASEFLLSGARLAPGELELNKGVARIQLDGGAELVVEGPARVRLDSVAAAAILLGKAVFRIESGAATATPFALSTPTAILIPTGAECAVEVAPSKEQLHVFKGEVERRPLGAAGDAAGQVLAAGEAREYSTASGERGELTVLDVGRFIRDLPGSQSPERGLLAFEGFDYTDRNALRNKEAAGGLGWLGPWESTFTFPYGFGFSQRRSNPLNIEESVLRLDARHASVGGSFDFLGSARAHRPLTIPVRMDAEGTYYLSFLVCRDGPPLSMDRYNSASVALRQTADVTQRRANNANETAKRLEIGMDHRTNDLFAQLERASDRSPQEIQYNEAYLIVAKIVARKSSPDQVFARVYGPEEAVDRSEPLHWPVTCPPVNSDLTFDCLELRLNSWRRQTLDEVRLGTTWASVTAPWLAEPSDEQ